MTAIVGSSIRAKIVGKAVLWLAALLAPFVLIAIMDRHTTPHALGETLHQVRQVQVLMSNEAHVNELPATGWRDSSLPSLLKGADVGPTSAWYRTSFSVDAPTDALWAVYLSRPTANYAVFVNGHFVGDSGPMAAPIPLHFTPLIFRFPGSLLHPGTNVVYVRSVCELQWTGLATLQVGPDRTLSPIFRDTTRLIVTVQLVIAVCMLVMSIVMAVLAWARPQQVTFGWFAVAMFFLAVHIAVPLMPYPPFRPGQLWRNLGEISLVIYMVCAVFFINRQIGVPRPRIERAVLWWSVVGIAVMAADPVFFDSRFIWFFRWLWLPLMAPTCVYQTWLLARAAYGVADFETRVLAAMTWLGLVVATRDGIANMVSLEAGTYFPYASGSVLIGYGLILLKRFVLALDAAERARAELELRVVAKTRQLENNLVRLKDMERERALTAERERLVREMHDGVGGHLVQAVLMAGSRPENGEMRAVLERCLLELRFIVDSTDPANDDLGTALGTFRMQLERTLRDAPCKLLWTIDSRVTLETIVGARALGILRIVQEAVTNALKHSQASAIAIRILPVDMQASIPTHRAQQRWVIEIADNGVGTANATTTGRGMRNMKQRAVEAETVLSIESSSAGTLVRLDIGGALEISQRNSQRAEAPRYEASVAEVSEVKRPADEPVGAS